MLLKNFQNDKKKNQKITVQVLGLTSLGYLKRSKIQYRNYHDDIEYATPQNSKEQ